MVQRRCPTCRAAVREADKFCALCKVKLVSEQPPADAEAESPRVLAPEPIQSFVADEPGRTGRDDLLAAFRSLHGEEAWVVTEGFRTLAGIAVWRLSTPRPHLLALTLGFSQLDRALFPWEESGRGFELVCRLEATSESLPGWLISALDELLTHTFSVRPGELVRLGKVWCLATPEPGLERLDTVNGAVRVVSLSPRDGGFLQGDANELVPSSAPDDETGRTEVCWEFDDESTVSLFGLDVVMEARVRRHDSRAEALLAFEKAVTAQLQVQPGHRSVHRRPPAPRGIEATVHHPQLEQEVRHHRDQPEPARVYADWLEEQGDPRGVFAALSANGRQDELAWFLRHDSAALWGELAGHAEAQWDLVWAHGFLDELRISAPTYTQRNSSSEVMSKVLALPVCRLLRVVGYADPGDTDRTDTFDAVARSFVAPSLRGLEVNAPSGRENDMSMLGYGTLSTAWAALPALERLRVRGGGPGQLGRVSHDVLTHFIRESGGLREEELEAIVTAHWPRLQHLEVWTGMAEYGATFAPEHLERLLTNTPATLTSLGVVNCEVVADCVSVLGAAKRTRQLRRLDLSRGVLQDQDVDLVLRQAKAFAHLEVLDLSQNQLSEDAIEALRQALPNARCEHQREAGEEGARYTAVGE